MYSTCYLYQTLLISPFPSHHVCSYPPNIESGIDSCQKVEKEERNHFRFLTRYHSIFKLSSKNYLCFPFIDPSSTRKCWICIYSKIWACMLLRQRALLRSIYHIYLLKFGDFPKHHSQSYSKNAELIDLIQLYL